jgi:hypothetical protein
MGNYRVTGWMYPCHFCTSIFALTDKALSSFDRCLSYTAKPLVGKKHALFDYIPNEGLVDLVKQELHRKKAIENGKELAESKGQS